jgi:hypothetical protein
MPRSSINLRDPRVVMAVAVLLLVVVAVNLQTFLPLLRRGAGHTAWDPDAFVPPADTEELTRVAAGHLNESAMTGPETPPVAGADLGGSLRDPFRTGRAAVVTRVDPPQPSTLAPASRPGIVPRGPICSAVLYTGERAAAVIDGEARRVGDAVGDWRVAAIGPDGVRLQGPRGELFLEVGERGGGAARYPLVTQPAATTVGGSTALEPQPGSREP